MAFYARHVDSTIDTLHADIVLCYINIHPAATLLAVMSSDIGQVHFARNQLIDRAVRFLAQLYNPVQTRTTSQQPCRHHHPPLATHVQPATWLHGVKTRTQQHHM